jgi:F0F1-type ATP synthase epsilon subunit
LLTALDIGLMKVRTGDEWSAIFLVEGIAQVEQNEIKIFSMKAEKRALIDQSDAKIRLQTITKLSKTVATIIYWARLLTSPEIKIFSILSFYENILANL